MKRNDLFVNTVFFVALFILSTSINIYYGNLGVFPIDTFAFFDTAYSILLNKHPFKDIWITTGPFVDYAQAFFFKIFGLSWFSYLIHASFFNFLITITIFFTLKKLGLDTIYSFLYSLSVAILCYPVAGTPFAYQHSFILSVISLMLLFISIKGKSNFFWFLLPTTMVLAFFSMHVPSVYINFVIIISAFIYLVFNYSYSKIISFLLGSISILIITILFFIYFEIPFLKFLQQYILFPLSMGEYRVLNPDYTFSLSANLTFRRIFGHFKFIHIFVFVIIGCLIFIFSKKPSDFKKKEDLIIYSSLIIVTILLIFHQLITANQTFIFSIIPILAGFLHLLVVSFISKKKIYQFGILVLVIFITAKYHIEYNEKRKFMDLQNVNFDEAVSANLIDQKFQDLKWINPLFPGDPMDEVNLIKETINKIKIDKRRKMVLTPYQFFSVLLEEDLNIPNRWYLNNASHPFVGHKYFDFYKSHFENVIRKNDIQVIYTVTFYGSPEMEDYKMYIDNICLDETKINLISSYYKLRKC